MRKMTRKVIFGWLGLLLFGAACTSPSDIRVERETVDLAFPVFRSETTISDLINSGIDSSALIVHHDNRMGLYYETKAHVDVNLPALNDFEIGLPLPVTTLPDLPADGVIIKQAKFNEGHLSFSFSNTEHERDIKVILRINQLTKGNAIFSKTIELNYTGDLPVNIDLDYDLADYTMNASGEPLKIEYQASFMDDGSVATLTSVKMGMNSATFDWIAGIWEEQKFSLDLPNQNIGFFNHYYNSGKIMFTNPKLKVITQNKVGVSSQLEFNGIDINTFENGVLSVEGDFVDNDFSIAYPKMNEMGSYLTSVKVMNKSNSNIVEIFNSQPNDIDYDIDLVVSPGGNNEGFITKDGRVDLDLGVELPFEGKVNEFKVEKSFDVKFTNEYVQAATLKLQAINQIPLEARIQLYFLDNAGVVLDSLIAANGVLAISAANVDTNGDVIATKEWEEEVSISSEKWERIKKAIRVKLVTTFTSSASGQPPVSIKSNQNVQLNAGLKLVVLP